jgi:hypothetical protein
MSGPVPARADDGVRVIRNDQEAINYMLDHAAPPRHAWN